MQRCKVEILGVDVQSARKALVLTEEAAEFARLQSGIVTHLNIVKARTGRVFEVVISDAFFATVWTGFDLELPCERTARRTSSAVEC